MNDEGFEGASIDSVAVVEHPALLIGVTEVFEAGYFGFFFGAVSAQESEELSLVIKVDWGDSPLQATFLENLEVVLLIFLGATLITWAKNKPDDLICGRNGESQFFGPQDGGVDKVTPVLIVGGGAISFEGT